ncbi:hypothetical protein O181_047447 [Austropuccinia psidii MF-1]|uniref:Uncharacterized protein n=1 Tax=Austropuccinia psidii MF-1 TaxID=1389203 RepID=A0A9Q3HKM9_9BASI|nr:hypothetical protein [Austropuccinia psidii MF-1]
MTIVHKAGNIHRNYDGLFRAASADAPDNPVYVPLEAEPQIPIEGINITDIGTQSFGEVRESYKQYKLEYNTSVHSSTGQTPAILEKGWNPIIPAVTLRKDLIDFNIAAFSLKLILDKVKYHAKKTINDAFDYVRQKWDKSHRVPDLKVEELVLVSTFNFDNIKGPKKLKDPYLGPFVIVALHVTNEVQVQLSGELEQKVPPSHSA